MASLEIQGVSCESEQEPSVSDKQIVCQLCKSDFQCPKLLNCLHYFCKQCLSDKFREFANVKGDPTQCIRCPVCEFEIHLEDFKIGSIDCSTSDLPNSQVLLTLWDQDNIVKGSCYCVPCRKRNREATPVSWCYECRVNLCAECLSFHSAMPSLSSHITYKMEEVSRNLLVLSYSREICEIHELSFLMFCIEHKVPCCNVCIATSHRYCTLMGTNDYISTEKELRENIKLCIDKMCSDLNGIMEYNREQQMQLDTFTKEKNTLIQRIAEDLKSSVLLKSDMLITDVFKVVNHDLQSCELKISLLNGKFSVLENSKTILKALNRESIVRSFLEQKKVQSVYVNILKFFNVEDIKKDPHPHSLSFEEHLIQLTALESFGKLFLISEIDDAVQQSQKESDFSDISEPLEGREKQTVSDGTFHETPTSYQTGLCLSLVDNSATIFNFGGKDFKLCQSFSVEENQSHITGCSWISEYELVLVDRKNRGRCNARIYNIRNGHIVRTIILRGKPYDVAALSYGKVAITIPEDEKVVIHKVENGQFLKSIPTGMECYGINFIRNDQLVVGGESQIVLLDTDIGVIKTITVSSYSDIRYIYSVNNNLFFGTTLQEGELFSVIGNGDERFCYDESDLRGAAGVVVDCFKNAYVCEKGSKFLHKVDRSGNLVEKYDVGKTPASIAVSENVKQICIIRGGRKDKNVADIYVPKLLLQPGVLLVVPMQDLVGNNRNNYDLTELQVVHHNCRFKKLQYHITKSIHITLCMLTDYNTLAHFPVV